ncbi:hypothetical protein H6F67_23790 [Microcoleus sp. FACHB-1515]|nr:hypothetical protein [Microcoleus sp. FACHB-1515]MBD2092875.1 hypothetical protein [Microcoleus sp. FACHB-1515]
MSHSLAYLLHSEETERLESLIYQVIESMSIDASSFALFDRSVERQSAC